MEPKRITIKQRISFLSELIKDEKFGLDRSMERKERSQLQYELQRDGNKWWN